MYLNRAGVGGDLWTTFCSVHYLLHYLLLLDIHDIPNQTFYLLCSQLFEGRKLCLLTTLSFVLDLMQLNYKLTETLGLKFFAAQPDLLVGTNNTALGYL